MTRLDPQVWKKTIKIDMTHLPNSHNFSKCVSNFTNCQSFRSLSCLCSQIKCNAILVAADWRSNSGCLAAALASALRLVSNSVISFLPSLPRLCHLWTLLVNSSGRPTTVQRQHKPGCDDVHMMKGQLALQHSSWLLRKAIVKDFSSEKNLRIFDICFSTTCPNRTTSENSRYNNCRLTQSDSNHGDPVPPGSFKSTPR